MIPSSDPALILPSPDVTTSFPRAIESMNVSSGWCMARSGFGVSSANTDKCNNKNIFQVIKIFRCECYLKYKDLQEVLKFLIELLILNILFCVKNEIAF